MIRFSFGLTLVAAAILAAGVATTATAATVTPQVLVNFDGTLSGTTYTLGAGELDNSGTFASNGSATVAAGVGDVPGDSDETAGFLFHGPSLGLGNLTAVNWISEAWFSPDVPAAEQPTITDPGNHILDVQGDTFVRYDGFGRDPKVLTSGYWDGGSEIVNVGAEPAVDVFSHIALVWDASNTSLEAYINGSSLGTADQNAFDVSSPWIGYGFFARFLRRAVDGQLDSVAFSTFEGTFDPAADFQLYPIPEPGSVALASFAIGGLALWRRRRGIA